MKTIPWPLRAFPLFLGEQYIPDGSVWRDPPQYWEHIVWPAYVSAHKHMFEGGDVESGKPTRDAVHGMLILENEKLTTTDVVNQCCEEIARVPVLESPNLL